MIGKTRQESAAEIEEVFDPEVGAPRGVLKAPPEAGKFRMLRRSPAPDLAHFIAHYWMVRWDLRGQKPHVQETLPHPNIHVVFEKDNSMVGGVTTGKFTRVLEGRSHVFGIKFRPGGFHSFLKSPVSSLTNRTVAVNRIFGKDVDELEAILVSSCDEDTMVEAASVFFRSRTPEPDETAVLAGQLVDRILEEPDIKTVDNLVGRTGIAKRSLQRIFNEYVGINPKWVIRRYRLHELVERLNSGEPLDWAQLALELGYFDQAHLINDFRSIVGYSPTRYQNQAGGIPVTE
jgi:AraC-like DNA-binding protein